MATFNYAEMQAVADELIAEFGQQGTVTRTTTPDPIEGGDGTTTAYPAKLVPMAYSAREIDGTNILAGDVQIYISSVGLAIEPKPGDHVTASGKTFRIINGDPNNYDGITNVVFIVQGRIAS
ncbi:hypothetical protein GR138_12750 [Shinella kummerowiae]|uniref:Uncharacterized protein n=1 Tax=Shinella kummerowiae TaxID=417745 RepID=A0A6N8SH27_9HYPH|nr:hypothetical protein [Shinella kummerowiae]MXN46060.1 hypothetical protein [Shinella kummerowiae]